MSVLPSLARARWLFLIGVALLVATPAALYWGCSRASRRPEPAPVTRGPPGTVGSVWTTNVAARTVTFPLRLSDDRRHVVDQGGGPFLIHGEAAWSLIAQLERADVEIYLEDRKRRGFNLLMVNLLEHHFSDKPPANAYGIHPFHREGDFAAPNLEYFAHADWVIQRALDKGLAVLLCPSYLGFAGGEEGWFKEIVRNGPEKMRAYGRFVGDRYKGFPNIVWLEGGDYNPPAEHIELVNAVAEGIKAGGARQLQAAHWSPEVSGAEIKVSGWLDLDTTYTYDPVYLKSRADYQRSDGRPHFLLESTYEAERQSTPWSLRGQAYHAVLTGAAGHIFGSRDIWRFTSGWTAALGSAGSVSMTHVRALLESVRWPALEPDQQNQVLVRGMGKAGDRDYAVLSSDQAGTLVLAYVPAVREIGLNLSKMRQPLRGRWYDPSNGTFADAALPAGAGDLAKMTPPGKNAAGDEDWVLLIEHTP